MLVNSRFADVQAIRYFLERGRLTTMGCRIVFDERRDLVAPVATAHRAACLLEPVFRMEYNLTYSVDENTTLRGGLR